ncbi:MAG: hypothetical protein ACYC27_12645 [Armatimonadota bacterium]
MRYLQLAIFSFMVLIAFNGIAYALSVENEHLSLKFNDKGDLISIYNKVSNKEFYHGNGKIPIRVLYLADKKLSQVQLELKSSDIKPVANGNILTLVYSGEGVTASVEVKVIENDPKSLWGLAIKNNGDREIVEVIFPDFDNIHIGDSAKDDTLVRPNRYGEKIPNPSENLLHKNGDPVNGMKYQEWWNKPTLVYPGEAGMFWMDLYDSTGGIYIASEDKSLIGGYLANTEDGEIGMSIGKYLHVTKSQKFSLIYAVGVHTGDWHWGADRYREWANTFMHKASTPRWVREMPSWYWVSSIWSMGSTKPALRPAFRAADFDGVLFDRMMALQSDVIGLGGLEMMGHDYPIWSIDPLLGDEAIVRDRTAKVKRRGGHIVPYINPIYSWEDYPNVPNSKDKEFQARLNMIPADAKQLDWNYFKNLTAMKYDGTNTYVEMHYHGNYPLMCMASKEWQDYVLWWTHKYAVDYGFSGVQWDQLGAYPIQYCANWTHGHQHAGSGTTGILDLCRRIYNDPEYKVDPEFYIWYEGVSDIAGQYLQGSHSGYDNWMAYGFPDLMRYTFQHEIQSGEYFDQPDLSGPAAIRNKRSVEVSLLGRYKLGTGTSGPHAYKVSRLAPMLNAVKGIYWYTNFKDDLGCTAPEGMQVKVLEIDPEVCPYVDRNGYIIPYVDIRDDRSPSEIKLSKKLYDLSGISKIYWYPSHLQGFRQEISYDDTKPDYLSIKVPDLGEMNTFTYDQAYCSEDDTVSSTGLIVIAKQELKPITIIAPIRADRLEEIEFRTVERTVTGSGPSVSAVLGSGKPAKGIAQVIVRDGRPTKRSVSGIPCLQTSKQSPYIYFDIRDKSMTDMQSIVEVTVSYFDEGKGTFRLEYNSTDPYAISTGFGEWYRICKGSSILFKQDTRKWKTATFLLPDAMFSGKLPGRSDFRLHSLDGTDSIASVTVTKKLVIDKPVPNATLCIGDDKQTTNSQGVLRYTFGGGDPIGSYRLDAYKDGTEGYLPSISTIALD